MKVVTLRNLPPELVKVIEEEAAASRTSLNKTVIRLLERAIGVGRRQDTRRYHDLDELAGAWDRQQAEEFDEALAEQRRIDPELWG